MLPERAENHPPVLLLEAAEVEPEPELEDVPPLPPRHRPTPPGLIADLSHLPPPQSASSQQNFAQTPTHVSPPLQNPSVLPQG